MGAGAGNVLGKVGQVAGMANPILGAGFGIANMISGARQTRDAEEALNAYERQKLENVAEGLQVSTLGADLQREEQARLASSQVSSAREGGARTMIGSLGRIEAGNQRVNQQIGADLDMQQKQIDQMRAEDDARIRAMQENREIQDISALSSQYNAGQQIRTNGMSQAVQGTSMIGNAFAPPTAETTTAQGSTTPLDLTNPAYQSPTSMRNLPDYPNQPILTNPSYNPMNYGPQNSINPFALPNPYQITRR